MDQFRLTNAQQQPYIRSGYNAMGRLNTLLGLGSRPQGPMGAAPSMGAPMGAPTSSNQMYRPGPGGGVQQIAALGPQAQSGPQNQRLAQLLALRAQNGDTEAARILQGMQ